MIKIRLSSIEKKSGDSEIPIKRGENLRSAVERVLKDVPLGDFQIEQVFSAVVNGYIIPPEAWAIHKLQESDHVLIAPFLSGDSEKQYFKAFAIIAITLVASYFLTPVGGATVYSALGVAAVSVGATLALNAIIPPPVPDVGALSGGVGYEDSQMYAIANQSNSARKLQTVPKVYGVHRIFPIVAANPYTELESDPDSDGFLQYFYGIYDFGLGPLTVSDIRIGDTPIAAFTDVQYFFVDPNRPATDEGTWDIGLRNDFVYFKGSASSDSFSYALDKSQTDGGFDYLYSVTRNSAENVTNTAQTITLSFINQRGLYAFATDGTRYKRKINLEIFFSKVGEDNWKGFNDFDFVNEFAAIGGASQFDESTLEYFITDETVFENLGHSAAYQFVGNWARDTYLGYKKGTQTILVKNTNNLEIGASVIRSRVAYTTNTTPTISSHGVFVGRVQSIVNAPGKTNYKLVTFEQPLREPVRVARVRKQYIDNTEKSYNLGLTTGGPFAPVPYTIGQVSGPAGEIGDILSVGRPSEGKAYIEAATSEPFYSTFSFTPKEIGQFKIRIVRTSATSSEDANYQIEDSLVLSNITTRFSTNPINTTKRHVFLELRIRATSQLNGAVANLSAVCSSVLDVWTGSAWEKQITNNPAWVFADLLTGEANKRAISKSRLHTSSLLDWANYCDQVPNSPASRTYSYPRFETNFVLDFSTTLQGILNQVANAAQASMNIIDGKYGVLIDRARTVPVQVFTPRNSRNFSSSKLLSRRPDGLQISFIDPQSDWQVNQVTVYDSGFNVLNATDFEELSSFACTNEEQAWRFGRYLLAQNRLRQETISLTVDFEYLVCTRGDYVQFVQDVMKVGGTAARVKSVVSSKIVVDEGYTFNPAKTYGYTFRGNDGVMRTGTISSADSSDTFNLVGSIPVVGNLIVIGESGKIVYDCVVKSINPNEDLTATLTLVEKADAIFDAESTDTFPAYNPRIVNNTDVNAAPGVVKDLVVLENSYRCFGNGYQYFVKLDWDTPLGSSPEYYQVFASDGTGGLNEVGTTRKSDFEYTVDQTKLGQQHEFRILAVSSSGKKIQVGLAPRVFATPLVKSVKPQDVASLHIDITGEVLQLVWPKVDQCDIAGYLVRYSPNLNGTWLSSIPLLRADRNSTLAATQARTGIYLIKAVDFAGNESANAREVITTIPQLFNLNVIEEVNDFPTLNGVKDKTMNTGGVITLQNKVVGGLITNEFYPNGYYYFENLLDLGDIYTVRLQSLMEAEGATLGDILENWVTLDDVDFMANAGSTDWDVETQYRSTEALNVMAEWVTLDAVDPIAEGLQESFTPWRKFIIGDATGRIFQFRLELKTNKVSVSPRVFSTIVRADMADRVESFDNLTSSGGVYTVAYSPVFAGPGLSPNVQISIENAQSGDYWTFDYKTLQGFKIRFFNSANVSVNRTFDAVAKGYGRKYASVI